jgi:hypothetical protein
MYISMGKPVGVQQSLNNHLSLTFIRTNFKGRKLKGVAEE